MEASKMPENKTSGSDPRCRPLAVRLDQILSSPDEADNELIKNRLLCRGGAMLLVGPTGIGKSTFNMQMMINFALGKPMFGLIPGRLLRILIVQSENDEGDLAEMRDGAFKGLQLSTEEAAQAAKNIYICSENEKTGITFVENVLRPLLERQAFDLIVIDPLLGYLGGDMLKQDVVSEFARKHLSPLIKLHKCGVIGIHHTNKSQNAASMGDAYAGAGSAEWANWARAVMVLVPKGKYFKLTLPKRGARAGWKKLDGTPSLEKILAHSEKGDSLYWLEIDSSETFEDAHSLQNNEERRSLLLGLVPVNGTISQDELSTKANKMGLGKGMIKILIKELCGAGILQKLHFGRSGTRPAIHLSRNPKVDFPTG